MDHKQISLSSIKCTTLSVKMKSLFGKILNASFCLPTLLTTSQINVKQQNFPTHKRFQITFVRSSENLYPFSSLRWVSLSSMFIQCENFCSALCFASSKQFSSKNSKLSGTFEWILFICVHQHLTACHVNYKSCFHLMMRCYTSFH